MSNKISIIIILALSLLLLSCSSSKSTFSHPQYGELSPSSPLLNKELRSCSEQIKEKPIDPISTVGDVAISSIPVILQEDVVEGIQQGAELFQAIKTVRTINNVKNITQQSRNSLLSCMEKKGWRAVER